MKTIIVATDYSNTANNALQYAAHLASVIHADLVLFNAFQLPVHASNTLIAPAGIDKLVAHNENRLQALAAETARKYPIKVGWVSKISDTVDELERQVDAYHADLVVMGMESNLLEDKLFGNTTTAAIRRLKFPVLVVPNDVPFKGIDKILFACEYSYLDENNNLELLKEFAQKFNARLQVFHVETNKKEVVPMALDMLTIYAMDEKLAGVDHAYSYTEREDIGEGITKGIQAFQADMLVMVPHKAGFLASLFKGSITRKMTLRTKVPLLVLPNL